MNNEATSEIIQILVIILIPIIILIVGLIAFLVYLNLRDKNKKERKENAKTDINLNSNVNSTIDKQPIFNFMEFDTVKDNMIIQKNNTRFLMIIECQGINYDLMSGVEKTGVEEGFVQFLNTLRYQIQIYIQTRSINLESSLQVYRKKVKEVEDKYKRMKMQYEQMVEDGIYSEAQLQKAFYELTKQANLYEYGKSVLQDTEMMSLNKNILNKKYYIVVPYYSAEAGSENLDKAEIEGIAFSELYTRSQSLIRSISTCGVRGRILSSNELVELLYMAYNREEAETFGLDKAIRAEFNQLYSTAPDVLKKKMKELDKMIEEKALEKAREKVDQARSELEQQIEEKEENLDDLIADMVKIIITENEQYIGTDVKNKAIEKVEEENTKEGGKKNVQKEGKTTRNRNKSTT